MELPEALLRVRDHLARLPGVGERTALRLAFFLLRSPAEDTSALADALGALHGGVRFCQRCHHLADEEQCAICRDPRRDVDILCVVEGVPDLLAIERTGEFRGRYHVLHGVLSPLRGIGPGELTLSHLVERVRQEQPNEVILATQISVEGEATAAYIQSLLGGTSARLSRIASGVPQGAELEYLDHGTLGRALAARTTF